jgi:hypothetical protein
MINVNATAMRLSGRLTKDARTTVLDNGTPVTNFTIAFANGMRPQVAQLDGREILAYVESTTYLVLAAWESESVLAASLKRGQTVTLDVTGLHAEGRLVDGVVYSDICGRASAIEPGAESKNSLPSMNASAPADAMTI